MDRLTLRIENRSDAAGDMPEDISVLGQGISIGRKADNDWALPDNTRFISGRHISISYDGTGYVLEDVSTNGTFINGNSKRVEGKHTLENGDMIRIGSYIVAVEIDQIEESARPQIKGAQGVQAPPMAGTMRTPTTGIQRHTTTTTSARSAQTPDFSRFQAGAAGMTGVQRPGGGVSQPPVVAPPKSPAAVIPDDFDDDLLGGGASAEPEPAPAPEPDATPAPKVTPPEPDETPAAQIMPADDPAAPQSPAPAAAPELTPVPPLPKNDDPFATSDSEPAPMPSRDDDPFAPPAPERGAPRAPEPAPRPTPPSTDGPFSLSDPTAAPVIPPERPVERPASVVEKTDMTPRGLGERFAETTPPGPERIVPRPAAPPPQADAAPEPAPAPAAPPPPATNELLEGFLAGAEVDDPDTLAIPLRELGEMLGRCARLGTQEMMQMLQDRSAVKLFVAQEDRTMRIASGNNPMKFMIDPDEAFTALFVKPRDGYQTGPDGFDNALTDIRQHQQAMMAAIQPALADMLEGLAPTEISADVGGGGGMMGSGARKSWEEYTKRWESRAAQGENGMLDAFLDAFARRYNQALDSL